MDRTNHPQISSFRLNSPNRLFALGGLGALDPPISSPKKFRKKSFTISLIQICILCTPPYGGGYLMRIPRQNPMGGGDHPGPLVISTTFSGHASGRIPGQSYHDQKLSYDHYKFLLTKLVHLVHIIRNLYISHRVCFS